MKKKEKKLAKALKKEQEASTAPPATAAIEPATVEEPEKKVTCH